MFALYIGTLFIETAVSGVYEFNMILYQFPVALAITAYLINLHNCILSFNTFSFEWPPNE